MPFGLASSQCAAVAQARIVRLHPTPPVTFRAHARAPGRCVTQLGTGRQRKTIRTCHDSANVATWMGPDQLLSHAPLRRCARAPVALTAYGWPSFKTSFDPHGCHKVRARRGGQARAGRANCSHTADVRAEESTVNNYGVLGFLCVSDALFCTHVNSSWYN